MRSFLRAAGRVSFALLVTLSGHGATGRGDAPASSPAHPSVLLVTIDTLRADHVGCYGYKRVATPVLDRLAAEGLRFDHAYAQAPITLPSHAVILTGTYPMFNGVRDFTSPGLPENIPTLAEILRRQGYQTAAFVSSFVLNSMWGLNRGFELYDDNLGSGNQPAKDLMRVERRGDRTTDRLLAWLEDKPHVPFFAWLHLYDPHSPYRPPAPFRDRYAGHPYDGEIAFDDAQLGRVFDRLRALRLYDSTLIVVLSDHGESLGEHGESEHGFFVYGATLRVPLIVKLPGGANAGRTAEQVAGTVDVAPTIAQVCNVPDAETRSFQGRSLLGTNPGISADESATVYAESYYPRDSFGWHELRAVVTERHEYIEAPRPELYDLRRDPGERQNILGAQSTLAATLRERLEGFERKYGRQASPSPVQLDPETLEKLKSLGYLGYKATTTRNADADRADPKDKIGTLNRILRAADLTRAGQFAAANQILARLQNDEPDLYVLAFQKGENDLAWGKPQPAAEAFRKALALNPTFDQAALGLGRAYFLLNDDAHAANALGLALQLNPRNFLARAALAKVCWRQNKLRESEAELAKVVSAHPEFAEGHADYGIILAKLAQYPQAVREIQSAIAAGYQEATAFNYLGIALAETGEPDQAMQAYERAVSLNPRYAAAYLNLALQYHKRNRPSEARRYFETVCRLSNELCQEYRSQFSQE